ncbi:MAG: hypothetical protein JOY62_00130 [Acidobacteriaceae bacterium]|nr:hypothetical protein [Acidobacteriaceae bacterium]
MIAADTSTWIAFFEGQTGKDVELLDRSLQDRQVLMVPPVLTELLSDPDGDGTNRTRVGSQFVLTRGMACSCARQVDWRRRENPFAEASAPGGSRNGSTEMRS